MAEVKEKIKHALDESRMLILGSQVLVGFDFRSVFEPGFEQLPARSRYLEIVALTILLIGTALLMSPGAYHRIVRNGEDTEDVHQYATSVMYLALLPFAIALGVDLYIVSGMLAGSTAAIVSGTICVLVALFFWYGVEYLQLGRRKMKRGKSMKTASEGGKTRLHDKIEQVLIEARVVLPGAQALLGFQFATTLAQSFTDLPLSSKYVHLISLALIALSIILLMSPAAFHRIVEKGEDTERLHKFSSWMLLAAMVPFPLGISGDFYVVLRKVTGSDMFAIITSAAMLIFFYGLWFGYTAYRRKKLGLARSG
jgi:hypothetical protein